MKTLYIILGAIGLSSLVTWIANKATGGDIDWDLLDQENSRFNALEELK